MYRNLQDELSSLQQEMKEQSDKRHQLTSECEQQQQQNNRILTEKEDKIHQLTRENEQQQHRNSSVLTEKEVIYRNLQDSFYLFSN